MSQEITNLLTITDYENLQESIITVEELLMNYTLTEKQFELILEQSIIYGNYFTYEAIDAKYKNDETHARIRDSVIDRINSWLEDPRLVNFLKEIVPQTDDLKKIFIDNYKNEVKCYEYFKQYAILEFTLDYLINSGKS